MRGIGAGQRIFELLDRTPAIPTETGVNVDPTRRGTIKFEHVSFEVNERDVVVLQGKSGSG